MSVAADQAPAALALERGPGGRVQLVIAAGPSRWMRSATIAGMNRIRYIRLGARPQGLLAQLVGIVLSLAVLLVSLVVGAFLLAGLLGFIVLAAAILLVRGWWLGRRMARGAAAAPDDVIEAEYRVVHTETVERRRRE